MLLKLENVNYSKNKTDILKNISLVFNGGNILGLIGENGCGKTSLLKVMSKYIYPDLGNVYYKNKSLILWEDYDLYKDIGLLIGQASMYSHLTVYENLNYLSKIYGLNAEQIERTLEIIGLINDSDKKVKNISLGMKQRLGLGFAFMHKPNLIILDEPMNGLDQSGIEDFKNLIKKLNSEEGISFIIVSHLYSVLEDIIDDIGVMKNGRLLFLDQYNRRSQGSLHAIQKKCYARN